jgi:hypothetical protein
MAKINGTNGAWKLRRGEALADSALKRRLEGAWKPRLEKALGNAVSTQFPSAVSKRGFPAPFPSAISGRRLCRRLAIIACPSTNPPDRPTPAARPRPRA